MSAGFSSWLLGTSLGANALGGMLGMAIGIFMVLAATTFGSALLYAISGFGFAVLAVPLFLLFLDPARANSARHHHLDRAIDRCASGAVAGDRAVALTALGARQSCWTAARPCRVPLC
jgi:hypothetical protein